MDFLSLYSKNCKTCQSLDPDAPNLFPNCHFEKGNADCPAREVQLIIVGPAKRLAAKVKEARMNGDLKAESRLLAFAATKSKAFQQKFQEWVR
jgi:hypothetical protein